MMNEYPDGLTADEIETRERMARLALDFPTLSKNIPGVSPWDARRLEQWATTSGAVTAGSRCAVQFLLYVWDPGAEWRCGPFSLRDAYGRCDPEHWRVIQQFVQAPFFP